MNIKVEVTRLKLEDDLLKMETKDTGFKLSLKTEEEFVPKVEDAGLKTEGADFITQEVDRSVDIIDLTMD